MANEEFKITTEGYKYYFRATELAETVARFLKKWAAKVILQNPTLSEQELKNIRQKLEKFYMTNDFRNALRDRICGIIGYGDGGWTSQYFEFKQFCVGIFNSASGSPNGELIAAALSTMGLTLEDVGINSPSFSDFALRASMPECAYGNKLEMWQWGSLDTNGRNKQIATLCVDEIPVSKFVSSTHVHKEATLFVGDNKKQFEERDKGIGEFVDKAYKTLLVSSNAKLKDLLSQQAWFKKRIDDTEDEISGLVHRYIGSEYQQKVAEYTERKKQIEESLKEVENKLKVEKEKVQTDFYSTIIKSASASNSTEDQATTSNKRRK